MTRRYRLLRIIGLVAAAGASLSAYARYAVRRYEDLDFASAEAPGAFVEVDGVRVHYVEAGRGAPVLLIHGLGGSTFSFRFVIAELAQHFRVVAVDLKGFGYSARPQSGAYSLTAQADFLRNVIRRLQLEGTAVVGHSMGGAVAMRLALRHPELVSRLVLVNSASDLEMRAGSSITRWLRPFKGVIMPVVALFTLHRPAYRRFSRRSAVHDPALVTAEVLDGYARPTRMKGHAASLAALAVDRSSDELLQPENIQQPTLIMWGEHDRLLPPKRGEELARRIPDARLIMIRGAGHMPLEEQPASCNLALQVFLSADEIMSVAVPRTNVPG